MAGFRKAHMRAFCYSTRDMNYRQMNYKYLRCVMSKVIFFVEHIS